MAAATGKNTVFHGTFIHSVSLDTLEYLHNTSVFVDATGTIVAIERDADIDTATAAVFGRLGWRSDDVVGQTIPEGQFIFPGFIGSSPSLPLSLT
jgi:guanine deaminase